MHDIKANVYKTLAEKHSMIRYQSQQQLSFEEFRTPFEINLTRENRWVKLAESLPWDRLAAVYNRTLSATQGRPAVDARVVIGSLIIKHKEGLSDEDTIIAIQENVYQQYFLGLHQYQYTPVFDPSLFVTIRKRVGVEAFDAMELELITIMNENDSKSSAPPAPSLFPPETGEGTKEPPSHASSSTVGGVEGSSPTSSPSEPNEGIVIVDLTVAPADIAYPTDMELLNSAREKTEELIDTIYHAVSTVSDREKPRTYRKKARKDYLAFAKKRKRSIKTIRKAIRKQLNYVGRNIKSIHSLLDITPDCLSFAQRKTLWVVQELYRQQKELYDTKTHRIADRIVSIAQPHVRPIVRGKAKATTEFGAQVSGSVVNGIARVHRIAWDAYNEASDLQEQVEQYKRTYGHYPAVVLADKKYGTRENRVFLKERGIHYGGTPLGRPKKEDEANPLLSKQITNQRNHIEGKFGTGKRAYGLDCIKARRCDTSASWIATIFFVMNLQVFLKSLGASFLSFVCSACTKLAWCWERSLTNDSSYFSCSETFSVNPN